MEKLNKPDLTNLFQDVRSSYRLLALYQKRLLDLVNYIGNQYSLDFERGGPQFCKAGGNGKYFNLDYSGWNYLVLYFYSFKFSPIRIGEDIYRFRIIHQADTGFYDNGDTKLSKLAIDNFNEVDESETRLFLILCKNDDSFPLKDFLPPHLSKDSNGILKSENEDWVGVSYDMMEFINKEATDKVLRDFNEVIKSTFNIEILKGREDVVS
ncbi:hypothetical protein [Salegentibacter sediminis]|uniref:hypothetical protein n=1 Tax=Salegentibacter sediminis TaxID=1930251 RepID=UPI0009C071EB|nr:hypothetical protein [Salegentibacter sediminis]